MTFKLGKKSLEKLSQINPSLGDVVREAINTSSVDFTVIQGIRTKEEQEKNFLSGASQILKGKHLTGDAVDLAAWVNGKVDYAKGREALYYLPIAEAMRSAAVELDIPIIWGCAWKRVLNDWPNALAAHGDYLAERKRLNKKPFFDWGHFELV